VEWGERSNSSEPWSVDGFRKSGVDPSGFANTNFVSETNQSTFHTHTMCRMASTRRCSSCGISSSPVCTIRLKQKHTETLSSREIYDQKRVRVENIFKIRNNWRHVNVDICNICHFGIFMINNTLLEENRENRQQSCAKA